MWASQPSRQRLQLGATTTGELGTYGDARPYHEFGDLDLRIEKRRVMGAMRNTVRSAENAGGEAIGATSGVIVSPLVTVSSPG
jgi:hypothetical protein